MSSDETAKRIINETPKWILKLMRDSTRPVLRLVRGGRYDK